MQNLAFLSIIVYIAGCTSEWACTSWCKFRNGIWYVLEFLNLDAHSKWFSMRLPRTDSSSASRGCMMTDGLFYHSLEWNTEVVRVFVRNWCKYSADATLWSIEDWAYYRQLSIRLFNNYHHKAIHLQMLLCKTSTVGYAGVSFSSLRTWRFGFSFQFDFLLIPSKILSSDIF